METEEPLSARRWGPGGGRGGGMEWDGPRGSLGLALQPSGRTGLLGAASKAGEDLRGGRPHGRAPQSVVVLVLCNRRHAGTVATPRVPVGRALRLGWGQRGRETRKPPLVGHPCSPRACRELRGQDAAAAEWVLALISSPLLG